MRDRAGEEEEETPAAEGPPRGRAGLLSGKARETTSAGPAELSPQGNCQQYHFRRRHTAHLRAPARSDLFLPSHSGEGRQTELPDVPATRHCGVPVPLGAGAGAQHAQGPGSISGTKREVLFSFPLAEEKTEIPTVHR